jgi:hypothetical protein
VPSGTAAVARTMLAPCGRWIGRSSGSRSWATGRPGSILCFGVRYCTAPGGSAVTFGEAVPLNAFAEMHEQKRRLG